MSENKHEAIVLMSARKVDFRMWQGRKAGGFMAYNCMRMLLAGVIIATAGACLDVRAASNDNTNVMENVRVVNPIGTNWFPVVLDWSDTTPAEWDFSHYFHKPAGVFGPVRVEKEFFVVDNPPRRIRFWGCNLTAYATCPPKEQSPALAGHLAKLGFNAVRFTHLDAHFNQWALIDWKKRDVLTFNEESLDRWFFLIAELKRQGIYITLDGIHHFMFHLKEHAPLAAVNAGGKELRGKGLPFIYFVESLQEHHKSYLRKILRTVNPYTKLALAEDPALMGISIINEPFLANRSKGFRLKNVPSAYREQFNHEWKKWANLTHPKAAPPVDEFDTVAAYRIEFFQWLHERYSKQFLKFYRDELKVCCPISTTSGVVSSPDWSAPAWGDYAEGHAYFAHRVKADVTVDGKSHSVWSYANNYDWLDYLAHQRIGYQPFLVTEWNGCSPARTRYHAPLALVILMQRQQWDGAFLFTYASERLDNKVRTCGQFSSYGDPSRIANMVAAAAIFHGQLLDGASRSLRVTSSAELLTTLPTSSKGVFKGSLKYSCRLFNCPDVPGIPQPPDTMETIPFAISPDTPEPLERKTECARAMWRRMMIVQDPKVKIVCGYVGGERIEIDGMTLEAPKGEEYSLTALSLDGVAIKDSKRILVTLGPVSFPEGVKLGKTKIKKNNYIFPFPLKESIPMMKPSTGKVTLAHACPMKGWMLTMQGAKGRVLNTGFSKNNVTFQISPEDHSLWYLLEAESEATPNALPAKGKVE